MVGAKNKMNETDGIFWCDACNIPILDNICGKCSSIGRFCSSDLKPVFEAERVLFEKSLGLELPIEILRSGNRILLDGKTLYRFKVDTAKNRITSIEPIKEIKKRIVAHERTPGFMRKTLRANENYLRKKERTAVSLVKGIATRYSDRSPVIFFAGGKDSSAVSLLVKKALRGAPLFFADTTLEYPETYSLVADFSKRCGFKLIRDGDDFYKSPCDFFELCRKLGPPSIYSRWCCSAFKSYPVNKYYGEIREDVLAFLGIRKRESTRRRKYGTLSVSKKLSKQLSVFPIIEWKEADVWFFLLREEVPINALYMHGFSRIGCWPCPTGSFSYILRSTVHPELHKKLDGMLSSYADGHGRDRQWIEQNIWRLRRPKKKRIIVRPTSVERKDGHYVMAYGSRLFSPYIAEFLKPLGDFERNNGEFSLNSGSYSISGSGRRLLLTCGTGNLSEAKTAFEKQLSRALSCVSCGGCFGACPEGAIKFQNGRFSIDGSRCTRCAKCVKSECVAMEFGERTIRVRADPYAMTRCIEGLPMHHLVFPDLKLWKRAVETLTKKDLKFEAHRDSRVVCVPKGSMKEIEKILRPNWH